MVTKAWVTACKPQCLPRKRSRPAVLKPWRAVEHIADNVGPRGGEYWTLTLECGHLTFCPVPRFNLSYPKIRSAPRRMRCRFCTT